MDNLATDMSMTELERAAQKRDEAEDTVTMTMDLAKREAKKHRNCFSKPTWRYYLAWAIPVVIIIASAIYLVSVLT
jgi:hypothetical protein